MTPQGSGPFDTAYFTNLTQQINQIDVCADLQALVAKAMASIQAQISAVESQMAWLKPIAELLIHPEAELDKIVTWIGNYIDGVLKPLYQPYLNMIQQIEQTVQAIAALTEAIAAAAARIGACVVSVPALVLNDATQTALQTGGGKTGAPVG